MKRCIDSGLWVPNSRADEGDDKEEDATYEELNKEMGEQKIEWLTWIDFTMMIFSSM